MRLELVASITVRRPIAQNPRVGRSVWPNQVLAPAARLRMVMRMEAGVTSVENVLAEARRAGVDLDLLDSNLALSIKERWQRHDAALALVLKLEKARKERDSRLQLGDCQAR